MGRPQRGSTSSPAVSSEWRMPRAKTCRTSRRSSARTSMPSGRPTPMGRGPGFQGSGGHPNRPGLAHPKAKYQAYVDSRTPRTESPQGPARMMFARDVIGNSQQIAEALYADRFPKQSERWSSHCPFSFDHEDYVQIINRYCRTTRTGLGVEAEDYREVSHAMRRHQRVKCRNRDPGAGDEN